MKKVFFEPNFKAYVLASYQAAVLKAANYYFGENRKTFL